MTPEQWEYAHQVEKFEGGTDTPIWPEAFLADTRFALEPQFLRTIKQEWPSISGAAYAAIRVNNPVERN